jgi:hypothetical protein
MKQHMTAGDQPRPDGPAATENLLLRLEMLSYLAERCRANATSIGALPPAPNTFRAHLGAVLVRIVRRMLFWYTPQIASQNMLFAQSLSVTVQALRQISSHLAAVQEAANKDGLRADHLESAAHAIGAEQDKLGQNPASVQREAAGRPETAARLSLQEHRYGGVQQRYVAPISLLEHRQDELV